MGASHLSSNLTFADLLWRYNVVTISLCQMMVDSLETYIRLISVGNINTN